MTEAVDIDNEIDKAIIRSFEYIQGEGKANQKMTTKYEKYVEYRRVTRKNESLNRKY
jgi:hypothetical protein